VMAAGRLQVDPAAPAVTANAAARADTALAHSPAMGLDEIGVGPAEGIVSATNAFDLAAFALMAWASAVCQAVSVAAHARGGTVGALSAAGFTSLTAMDTDNAIDLGKAAEP
jgi:hypothetical protein